MCMCKKSHRYIVNKPPLLSLRLSADGGRITTSTVMPATHNEIKRDDTIGSRASRRSTACAPRVVAPRAAIRRFT